LIEAGVDAFHCSQRRFWEPEFDGRHADNYCRQCQPRSRFHFSAC
jgi:hypothetical protein